MSPLERYQQDLDYGYLLPDPAQADAVQQLQRVYDDLLVAWRHQAHWRGRLQQFFQRQRTPVRGVYLWGSVGIGKTYLMDTFFACLPTEKKIRLHFHVFMRRVHRELKSLQGTADPLQMVAQHISERADILCFDEFFVNDIGDAMILGNLLQALFARGVCLVATSNVVPDELYHNGLQRDLFLPAIAMLQAYTEVHHVTTTVDYRLRKLSQAGVYFYPLNEVSAIKMREAFAHVTTGPTTTGEILRIEQRDIATLHCASDAVWFDFNVICNVPRSQNDYLEIARRYHTVLVSQVPQIGERETAKATYLINLVDVFYDAKVKLIIRAAVPIPELYPKGEKAFEFQRTQSRLLEMQSTEYLQASHLLLGVKDDEMKLNDMPD